MCFPPNLKLGDGSGCASCAGTANLNWGTALDNKAIVMRIKDMTHAWCRNFASYYHRKCIVQHSKHIRPLIGFPVWCVVWLLQQTPVFFRPGSLQANVRNGGRRAEQVQGNGVDLSTGSDGFLEQQDPAHRTWLAAATAAVSAWCDLRGSVDFLPSFWRFVSSHSLLCRRCWRVSVWVFFDVGLIFRFSQKLKA